jgi:hypothetical protein
LPQLFAGAAQRDFLAFEITQYPLDMRRGAVLAPIAHGAVGKLQLSGGLKLTFKQVNEQFLNGWVTHA